MASGQGINDVGRKRLGRDEWLIENEKQTNTKYGVSYLLRRIPVTPQIVLHNPNYRGHKTIVYKMLELHVRIRNYKIKTCFPFSYILVQRFYYNNNAIKHSLSIRITKH